MAQPHSTRAALELFSASELMSLRAFYAGEPARLIRQRLPNPWPLVARHRSLDAAARAAVMSQIDRLQAGGSTAESTKSQNARRFDQSGLVPTGVGEA